MAARVLQALFAIRVALAPSSAGESVGDATGFAGASVGSAVGVTGSGDGVGPVEAVDDADAEAVTSFCIAPDDPVVVDEHPAIAAVASTIPMVSVLKRVLIPSLDPWSQGCDSPER